MRSVRLLAGLFINRVISLGFAFGYFDGVSGWFTKLCWLHWEGMTTSR